MRFAELWDANRLDEPLYAHIPHSFWYKKSSRQLARGAPGMLHTGRLLQIMQGIRTLITLIALAVTVVIPAGALAQEPTAAAYDDNDVVAIGGGDPADPADPVDPGDPVDPADPVGGGLPLTGFDAALLAGAGAGMLAFGVGMRTLTRRPREDGV
jgi:hypothetical protein